MRRTTAVLLQKVNLIGDLSTRCCRSQCNVKPEQFPTRQISLPQFMPRTLLVNHAPASKPPDGCLTFSIEIPTRVPVDKFKSRQTLAPTLILEANPTPAVHRGQFTCTHLRPQRQMFLPGHRRLLR